MALLKDQRFFELCQILQLQGQIASDPDRKAIEKAFRRLALKTHPDKVTVIDTDRQQRTNLVDTDRCLEKGDRH
jgi:preprotein translocase subunit Sec63